MAQQIVNPLHYHIKNNKCIKYCTNDEEIYITHIGQSVNGSEICYRSWHSNHEHAIRLYYDYDMWVLEREARGGMIKTKSKNRNELAKLAGLIVNDGWIIND